MKKTMWILSIISIVLTAVVLQFMPDLVPMHYNAAGEIDRWGSKYENFIYPILIIVFALFWHLLILYYEKKSAKTTIEKECAEILSNIKVLKIVGVSVTCMFVVMQGFFLYSAYVEANINATSACMDIGKLTCILSGALLIVIGNFMPKTKKNPVVGVRVKWSVYNDTTWMKSNRFGAVALMITGVLIVMTSVFVKENVALLCMISYIIADMFFTLIYSYRVYKRELKKKNQGV